MVAEDLKFEFTNLGLVGDWTLNSIVFDDNQKVWYCTGTKYNIGAMSDIALQPWTQCANLNNHWQSKMVAFDASDNMWSVGKEGNVAKWDGTSWVNQQPYNNHWQSKMIAFDSNNIMWCVGAKGNLAKWNGTSWEDQHFPGDNLAWIAFKDGDSSAIFCVTTSGALELYEPSKFDKPLSIPTNWGLKMITFPNGENIVYGVGNKDSNVGIIDNSNQSIGNCTPA